MKKMKKIIALLTMVLFLGVLIPSSAFCAEGGTSGASAAGAAAGDKASEGISTGTIVIGALLAALVAGGIVALLGKKSDPDTTSSHH